MDIKERATRVKILLLDVDGVLTDGKLYCVKDGLGIKLAQRVNIRISVISEVGIEKMHLGFNNKLPILEEVLGRLSLKCENVAFLGDNEVGFPMVVADSPEELKRHALYVREAIEFLLKQKGQWEETVKHYYA